MEELLFSSLRLATPLFFAALAGLMSERSGVIQIGLEGMMLVGALAAALTTLTFQSPWLGVISAALAGLTLALVFAFFALKLKTDQIVTGTATNLLALGICPFLTKIFYNTTGSTPPIDLENRLSWHFLVLAVFSVLLIAFLFNRTKLGLWLRFAGESPQALQSAGVSVSKTRWLALGSCGILAGLGGASLSLSLASAYSPNMTAGRGFMALAALIFGGWRPFPAFGACFLFAFVEALQIRLQGTDTGLPVFVLQILPYMVTIVALVGFFGRNRAPKGLGQHL